MNSPTLPRNHARRTHSLRRQVRFSAGAVVAIAAGALVVSAPRADATPVATGGFDATATSSILAFADLAVPPASVTQATVGRSTAGLSSGPAASSATASNLAATVSGIGAGLDTLTATAPPAEVASRTLGPVDAAPLLTAGAISGSVAAAWPATAGCPSATAPASVASVTSTGATAGELGGALPPLINTSAATATSSTTLVSAAGPSETRGVQASATNSISRIDLLGGSSGGGITVTITSAPVLTGTATGAAATSGVDYTPASGTVTVGAGSPVVLAPGVAVPINLTLGTVTLTGSLTLVGAATSVSNTGTSVSGDAALLSATLAATVASVSVAGADVSVAPMHVESTSPANGIQCQAPTATGLVPDRGLTDAIDQVVTITGTGFVPGQTTVTIGGVTIPATDVTVAPGGTSLTFVTPPHPSGRVDVTVTTPGGTTRPLTYTFIPAAPVIVVPGDGTTTSDTTPTIGGSRVLLGDNVVTVFEGGATVCTALVDSSGDWGCAPTTPLTCGSHTISARLTPPNGLVSAPSNSVTFTVSCVVLAATGSPTRGLLGLGTLFLVSGAAAVAAGRRRVV
jgi:hypothetical protein